MGDGEVLKRVEFRCVIQTDTLYRFAQAPAGPVQSNLRRGHRNAQLVGDGFVGEVVHVP